MSDLDIAAIDQRFVESADAIGDKTVRDELIETALPLARYLARRFAGRGEPLEDLIQVTVPSADGLPHTFDCFECAIEALAPRCARCTTKIIGHGIEAGDSFFCCAHCARESGSGEHVADRA